MKQVNVKVSDELKAQMELNSHINWTGVIRSAIQLKLTETTDPISIIRQQLDILEKKDED